MSGIAGCTRPGGRADVETMLECIAHRGQAGRADPETEKATLVRRGRWPRPPPSERWRWNRLLWIMGSGRVAFGAVAQAGIRLARDRVGVAPLGFGTRQRFALLCVRDEGTSAIHEGRSVSSCRPFLRGRQVGAVFEREIGPQLTGSPASIASELRVRLSTSVKQCLLGDDMASWLSGGLDSSVIAALARPEVRRLHTFAAGLAGAADLEYAQVVARFIQSDHHEIVVDLDDMLAVLPDVIYHLESFDALLVRSSIVNYLAGRVAADYAPATLSGEGGDELFAGYAYLKKLDPALLADELLDITARLHNTALQRVDRCSAAHGIVAHVPFLAPDVVEYAFPDPERVQVA